MRAMLKTLTISGKEVRVRATARTPFEYREYFFADLIDDMHRVCSGTAGAETLEIIERFLWICAKNAGEEVHQDLPVDDAIPAWLDDFEDMFAMYKMLPEVIAMWQQETGTSSKAKKNEEQQ